MGLLSSLLGSLTGYSGFKQDANVLLAEATFASVSSSERKKIVERIIFMMRATEGHASDDVALQKLNRQNRYVQMLFISIACSNIDISPVIAGWQWEPVRNPYSLGENIDEFRVNSLISILKRNHGLVVDWPGAAHSIDFSLYRSTPKEPLIDVNRCRTPSNLNANRTHLDLLAACLSNTARGLFEQLSNSFSRSGYKAADDPSPVEYSRGRLAGLCAYAVVAPVQRAASLRHRKTAEAFNSACCEMLIKNKEFGVPSPGTMEMYLGQYQSLKTSLSSIGASGELFPRGILYTLGKISYSDAIKNDAGSIRLNAEFAAFLSGETDRFEQAAFKIFYDLNRYFDYDTAIRDQIMS